MADGDMVVNDKRDPNVRVQDAPFLHIAVMANVNYRVVTADADIRPNACMFAHNDITNNVGRVKNKRSRINAWSEVAKLVNSNDRDRL